MWFDYKQVKSLVTMSQLLERYQVRLRSTERPRQLKGDCPIPTHASNSRNTFNVNLEKNCWSCFALSCKSDEISGNVLGFVMAMEGCDLKTAAGKITEWYGLKPIGDSGVKGSTPNKLPNPIDTSENNLVDWLESSTKKETSEKKEVSSEVVHAGDNPSPPDHNPSPVAVNPKGYMKDVDAWLNGLISDPPDWKKIRTAFKARLIESYKNGAASKS
jgi:CHC2 zinc finger